MNSKGLVHTYCSFISYIGTKFRGSQRQVGRRTDLNKVPEKIKMTIQHALDDSLFHIVPKPLYTGARRIWVDDEGRTVDCPSGSDGEENDDRPAKKERFIFDEEDLYGYRTYVTSRTDSGVCSTMNCYLFDLIHPTERLYKPDSLTMMMNRHLMKNRLDLLVNKTIAFKKPSMNFEVVKEKQYCYRLAFLQPELLTKNHLTDLTFLPFDSNGDCPTEHATRLFGNTNPVKQHQYSDSLNAYALYSFLPINELNRVLPLNSKYLDFDDNNRLVEKTINIERMKRASQLFYGTYDFTSFSTRSLRSNSVKVRSPIKSITRFEFHERNVSDDSLFDAKYQNFRFYDVYVKANGFLYNQIRRMMGCLLAHGFGLIELDDIQYMLNNPEHKNFHPKCMVMPSAGLYLNSVLFKDEVQEELDEEEIVLEEKA